MDIIEYFKSNNKAHWKAEIAKGDWSAAVYLAKIIDDEDQFVNYFSDGGRVFLLTDGDKLVSFATLSKTDCIEDDSLFPWIGFVYTSPDYRGHRYSEKLINHLEHAAKEGGYDKVYIATDHDNLYEKYGFIYMEHRVNKDGGTEKIYYKNL